MGKDEETEIVIQGSALVVCFFIRCWNNLRSGTTSLFDVGRSMFDVGRSSFKTTSYGINANCERLQNNLVLIVRNKGVRINPYPLIL